MTAEVVAVVVEMIPREVPPGLRQLPIVHLQHRLQDRAAVPEVDQVQDHLPAVVPAVDREVVPGAVLIVALTVDQEAAPVVAQVQEVDQGPDQVPGPEVARGLAAVQVQVQAQAVARVAVQEVGQAAVRDHLPALAVVPVVDQVPVHLQEAVLLQTQVRPQIHHQAAIPAQQKMKKVCSLQSLMEQTTMLPNAVLLIWEINVSRYKEVVLLTGIRKKHFMSICNPAVQVFPLNLNRVILLPQTMF